MTGGGLAPRRSAGVDARLACFRTGGAWDGEEGERRKGDWREGDLRVLGTGEGVCGD